MPNKFQKNLQDYVPEKSISDKTGKEQVRYIYRGEIYTFHMSRKQYRRLKLALPLSCAFQFALYFFIMLRRVPSNSSFVMLPAACSLFAMGYMDMGIFTLLTSGMELPGWEYRSLNARLKQGSAFSLCLFFLTFSADLAFSLFFSRESLPSEILNCFGYLLLTLISCAVHAVWKRISFDFKAEDDGNRKNKELLDDLEHAFGKASDFH